MENRLIIRRLRAVVETTRSGQLASDEQWQAVSELLQATAWEDEALRSSVEARDVESIGKRVDDWDADRQPLPPPDRAVLKRALKAFRKRLKLQILDDESRIGGGPFSGGRESNLLGIEPPSQYPDEVWHELALRKRITDEGDGFYGLVAED